MFDGVLAANIRVFGDGRWRHVLLACLICSGRWGELSGRSNGASLSERHFGVCRLMCNRVTCSSLHIHRPDSSVSSFMLLRVSEQFWPSSASLVGGTTVGVAARGPLTGRQAAMAD